MYLRFFSMREDMPHQRLQEFMVIDYSQKMVILAVLQDKEKETIIGLGQYEVNRDMHTAEVAIVVRDEYQNQGGKEVCPISTYLARRQGLLAFTAEVLVENKPMIALFEKMGFDIQKRREEGVYEMRVRFREEGWQG
jgi:RimJ/RimL family protein N-acetyltransferase